MEFHKSVLLNEAVGALNIKEGRKYIDATLGGGGHSKAILEKGGVVLGVDQDEDAINFVKSTIKEKNLKIAKANFRDLKEVARKADFEKVSGILFDLGVSAHHFDEAGRGFSFQKDAPLDMRMDKSLAVTALDLINGLNEGELNELFIKYGEESYARPIARAIVTNRLKQKIETTKDLGDLIAKVRGRREKIHPATRVFQALRIAVNDELNSLKEVLPQTLELLESGGRIVVISFHSLEDRIVKHFFKEHEDVDLRVITKKPLVPGEEEVEENPASRSAKMRVAEKI